MEKILFRIHGDDNVAVALRPISKGEKLEVDGIHLEALEDIPQAHKIALEDIKQGSNVIKYAYPIAHATENIGKGCHVHTHNVKTNLKEEGEYLFNPEKQEESRRRFEALENRYADLTFSGYERKDGKVGIRNSVFIVPTVGCVNEISKKLEAWANKNLGLEDGFHAWCHPFGCSQLGEDHETTRRILSDLVLHPNAGGVLVISLGCENNTLEEFKKLLGKVDEERIRFMTCQEEEDELESGKRLLKEIWETVKEDKRKPLPLSRLTAGMKCGGSDGLSGITANTLVGMFTDVLTRAGGSAMLTEVPEMFGAEQVLLDRASSKEVYEDAVSMINDFKHYFTSHGQVVYENPSPGNKKGGITTLEDKSLGCVQKGGMSIVTDVIRMGDRIRRTGLTLLSGPGNDIVSTTAQSAAGANLILFTTGRGTPLGSVVPTIKISSNRELAERKKNWIDFDSSRLLREDRDKVLNDFITLIIEVASGKRTRNEENGYHEISIFKDGVVL